MSNSVIVHRIITCQGTIQLITALGVIQFRSYEQRNEQYSYKNYLIIYDLLTPIDQIIGFVNTIKQIALKFLEWESIIYIEVFQMNNLIELQEKEGKDATIKELFKLIGIDRAEEIFLARNWQFGNQLLINAFSNATKIAYGDAMGIFFNEDYFNIKAPEVNIFFKIKRKIYSTIKKVLNYI